MAFESGFSKRQVSRAGAHLAARLREVRSGRREAIVHETDPDDVLAREVVEWWRDQHVAAMLAVHDVVAALAPPLDLGDDEQLPVVAYRPKRFITIVDKLTREPGKLADMADIGGVRAVADNQDDVDALHELLAKDLEIKRVRDWARNPQPTGYRAVHLHVMEQGRIIEVQLRTFGQDAWANVVEEESRLSGHAYKAGQGPSAVLEFFRLTAHAFSLFEGERHPDLPPRLLAAYMRARPELVHPRLRDLPS